MNYSTFPKYDFFTRFPDIHPSTDVPEIELDKVRVQCATQNMTPVDVVLANIVLYPDKRYTENVV